MNGISLGMGDGYCPVEAVYHGHVLRWGSRRMNCGGKDLSMYINREVEKRMEKNEFGFSSYVPRAMWLSSTKDPFCRVALDLEEEILRSEALGEDATTLTLPDGKTVVIRDEQFTAAELLFDPSFIGWDRVGIQEVVLDVLQRVQSFGFEGKKVFVSGGLSKMPGMVERVRKELRHLDPGIVTEFLEDPDRRAVANYLGGVVLASLSSQDSRWILKDNYEEVGTGEIVRRCCF